MITKELDKRERILLNRQILTDSNFDILLKMLKLPKGATDIYIYFDEFIAYGVDEED